MADHDPTTSADEAAEPIDPAADDVDKILDRDQLALLKKGYDRDAMNHAATAAVLGPFEPAAPFVHFVIDHFYDPERWPADRREQVLIALLTAQGGGRGLFLAVHLYWGMMEGLSVASIANTLLLTGAYAGIPYYSAGIGTLTTLCNLLDELTRREDAESAVGCMNVIGEMQKIFT